MRTLSFSALIFLFSFSLFATDPYAYTIDLTRVVDDKVMVTLTSPKIRQNEVTFYMPKIVPGTYAIADYGRMVSDFKALDKKGRVLEVERIDENTWKIKKAKKLRKITYWVEDTFDSETEGPEIFEPAGTNIEEGLNFIINTSGFFGYFEEMKKNEFQLDFIRNAEFYGATGLQYDPNPPMSASLLEGELDHIKTDRFIVEDYDRLIDSPLMYARADTAIIKVANTDVLVASYSPNNRVTAKEIAESISEILTAQNEFLGGELPVDKYAFIFYFTDEPILSYGALEHSYSSLYYMPEQSIGQMRQQLRDFAAHEFFHIVTPLNVHSEEIGSFDFNNPKMSRHLWMYEGITEYFAGSVQVKHGLVSPEQYLQMLSSKIQVAQQFPRDLPFTELSLGALAEHADLYYNVYQKGALIGAALDIMLRDLSDGSYGVQNMMNELSLKYGKDVSFKDETLFEEIEAMTYPEVGEFFKTFVAGSTPIDYEEIFKQVGVKMLSGTTMQHTLVLTNGNITVTEYEGAQRLTMGNVNNLDAVGQALGLQSGDIIQAMNGKELPALGPLIQAFMQEQDQLIPTRENFTMTVIRKINDEWQEVELSAKNEKVEVDIPVTLSFMDKPSDKQLRLRKYWLEPAK